MKRYLPCLAWTVGGLVLVAFWAGRLSREVVEPWFWCVVGLVLIAGGAQSGFEARRRGDVEPSGTEGESAEA